MKFSHETAQLLTDTAFSIAMQRLKDTGNQPHPNHSKALYAVLESMTNMAQGSLKGRWAFGLQTGLGKTTCAVSWTAALSQLGLAGEVSVVIAAQDVEALCETFDTLVNELMVDRDQIGLLHRKSSARHQATEDATGKPILLLCHARVRERFLEQFKYQGEIRDLLIYDESLVTTTSNTCETTTLYSIAGSLQGQCKWDDDDHEELGELSAWLTEVADTVRAELGRLKDLSITQSVMWLPQRPQETLERFTELVAHSRSLSKINQTILELIQLCQNPVKVVNFAHKGVLSYKVMVPPELKNIIILDASHPIRDLVRDDWSVLDAEEHLPSVKSLGFKLADLKQYTGTVVYQMSVGGGKDAMRKSFAQRLASQRRICQEVIEVLRHIPKTESTLIIAFKPAFDATGPVNFVTTLENDINAAGIGITMQDKQSVELVEETKKPRVTITTWGLHKGTNKHGHCQNEIQVGILHRSLMDIDGEHTGHGGDLSRATTIKRLKGFQLSEVAHDSFQAIGRVQCRRVVNGVALPVKVWLIHYGQGLREKLEPVMQGAVWKKWRTKYDEIPEGKEQGLIKGAARDISAYLDTYPDDVVKVKDLRKNVLSCARLQPRTLTAAVAAGLDLNGKRLRQGNDLVPVSQVFEAVG